MKPMDKVYSIKKNGRKTTIKSGRKIAATITELPTSYELYIPLNTCNGISSIAATMEDAMAAALTVLAPIGGRAIFRQQKENENGCIC